MTEHQLFCLFEPLNGSEGFCALKNAVSGACVAYAYGCLLYTSDAADE